MKKRTSQINEELAEDIGDRIKRLIARIIVTVLEKPWTPFLFGNMSLPVAPLLFSLFFKKMPTTTAYLWWSMG